MTDFRHRGACRGVDPELFFPLNEAAGVAGAREVCERCPVLSECLTYALDKGIDHGIWAATTSAERRLLRRHVLVAR
jgi:WhiB family redox-sensing transcriptional regulator